MRAIIYEGIELDVCPTCRSLWLDHGEHVKIVALGRKQRHSRDTGENPGTHTSSSDPGCSGDNGIDINFDGILEFIADAVGSLFDGF
jgi:hypothetical protein